MKYYIKSSKGYQQTEGMDQATVIRLLTELGATNIVFISEEEYSQYIQAHQRI